MEGTDFCKSGDIRVEEKMINSQLHQWNEDGEHSDDDVSPM